MLNFLNVEIQLKNDIKNITPFLNLSTSIQVYFSSNYKKICCNLRTYSIPVKWLILSQRYIELLIYKILPSCLDKKVITPLIVVRAFNIRPVANII